MRFYDALQMDPSVLKRKSAACDTKKEKAYYWTAIAVRSVLIVAFAIVFISLLSGVFGSDNTPLAVALFLLLLLRGMSIAVRARDKFGALLAVGFVVQVILQAVLNMAVVTNTIPNTGISLPFFPPEAPA